MKNEFNDFADDPKDPRELTSMWMDDLILPTQKFLEDNYHETWRKWFKLDSGEQWDMYEEYDRPFITSDNPATKITVNKIGPAIRQLRAYATARRSYISCKTENPAHHVAAVLNEKAVNSEWKRNKFHQQIKDCFLEAAIIGFGVGEVGWTTEVDMPDKAILNERMELRSIIKKDSAYFRKIDCFKFGYDLRSPTRRPEDGRFVYETFLQEPWYVVNNLGYDKEVRGRIRSKKEKPEAEHEMKHGGSKDSPYSDRKMYRMYRVWDKQTYMMYIFCKGVKVPLVAKPWPWEYLREFPIKMLSFIPMPYDYFPIGLPKWVEDLQFERNRTRTSMFHYRRTNNGGQFYTNSTNDTENKKFMRGDKLVVLEEGAEIRPVQNSPLPPEQFAIDAVIEGDMEKVMGLPAWAQGGTNSGRRAATEIMKSSQYTELRIDDIKESLDIFIEDIATDVVLHCQHNYDLPRITSIAGALGEYWTQAVTAISGEAPQAAADGKFYVTYDKNYMQGEFELDVESTFKERTDPATKMQNMQIFMQQCERVAMLAVQTQSSPVNIAGINFIEILRTMADSLEIRDAGRIINQLVIVPAPVVEQTALAAQSAQQPQTTPMAPGDEVFQQAVNPQSAVAGNILGALNGQPQ